MLQPFNFESLRPRARSDGGVAVVAVLYGLSIFSVLSLTILENARLEKNLRLADDPDLHVVLYAGGAASQTVIGRLNIPTIYRNQGTPDRSTEIRVPGAAGLDLRSELAAGWAYAVRLSPHARVCCDGGDNACSNVSWTDGVTEGTLSPALGRPLDARGIDRTLHFGLSSLPVPTDVTLDSSAITESAFLVRATRMREAPQTATGQPMVCRLESADRTVMTGTLHVQPGVDEKGQVTRISSGTLQLNYQSASDR
jgi:hypothetical protein